MGVLMENVVPLGRTASQAVAAKVHRRRVARKGVIIPQQKFAVGQTRGPAILVRFVSLMAAAQLESRNAVHADATTPGQRCVVAVGIIVPWATTAFQITSAALRVKSFVVTALTVMIPERRYVAQMEAEELGDVRQNPNAARRRSHATMPGLSSVALMAFARKETAAVVKSAVSLGQLAALTVAALGPGLHRHQLQ